MERENFGSRLGFLLVSAGCAIGIGNVWKFPFVTGQNGGGIFVLFYLLFLIIMGMPILTMELAVGRASRQSIVRAYQALEPKGTKWHIHGYVCIAGCALLMMYYTTVSGWMLAYFWKYAVGEFEGVPTDRIGDVFSRLLADPVQLTVFMAITVAAGFLVCSSGVQKGLERVTKVMMTGLFLLILVLVVHSLLLPGAEEGLSFYLMPSVSRASKVGIGKVITAAMNQSFFTLSLGVACMEIFGSYMSSDFTLGGESIRIAALDTFVALMAGLIIFPACFSYGVEPDAGPSLIFLTLPKVFMNMPGGRFWGAMFFLFMTFASFSTVITVFENLIATATDNFHWLRKKSVLINCLFVLFASVPCVLGYNIWSGVRFFGGKDVLDFEDFIVSNLLLPIGSLIYCLFCVTPAGWGFENYLSECNTGSGIRMSPKFKRWFQFGIPVLIIAILISGLH